MTIPKPLPAPYAWLAAEPAPRMLLEMLKIYGVRETPGAGNTDEIMGWAKETGVAASYTADLIPWCGLAMAVVAKRAGKPIAAQPLWARSWAAWGNASPRPALGDVMVFGRDGGGHVALYVGEDAASFHVIGGNQSDAVTITRIQRHRLLAARRLYTIAVPDNVRVVRLAPTGAISKNEA